MLASSTLIDSQQLAEDIRRACITAALDGHEHGLQSGLCHEGAWEAAVSAIRMIDVDRLTARASSPSIYGLLSRDPSLMRVRDLMTAEVATLRADDPLLIADDVMRLGRIRHLPVVDEAGVLQGIVSHSDLLRCALLPRVGDEAESSPSHLGDLSVSEVMTRNVVVTTPDSWLRDAAREMFVRKLGCLPVVDNRELMGILTEADFVRLVR